MVDRTFNPEEVREIGARACPAIANSYNDLASPTRWASRYRDNLFGSHGDSNETWDRLFTLFRTAVEDTPINLEAMGRALVEAADRDQENEDDLEAILAGLDDSFENHREDVAAEKEDETRSTADARWEDYNDLYG